MVKGHSIDSGRALKSAWVVAVLTAVVLAAMPLPGQAASATDPFTIVLVPDSQGYFEWYDVGGQLYLDRGVGQFQWIANNIASRNITFVTQVGDSVQNFNTGGHSSSEWSASASATNLLHVGSNPANAALVPYSLTIGNHNYDSKKWMNASDVPVAIRGPDNIVVNSSKWRSTFGPSRFAGQSWFGGSDNGFVYHDPTWGNITGVGLSTYQIFQAGGQTYLHLNLELGAPDQTLAWARSIMAANPGVPTMVSTHSLLSGVNFQTLEGNWRRYVDMTWTVQGNSGQEIWDQFLSDYDQIVMVMCGHTGGQATSIMQNDHGQNVIMALFDTTGKQMPTDANRNGVGWLRMFTINPVTGDTYVQTYSPFLDVWADNAGNDGVKGNGTALSTVYLRDCYDTDGQALLYPQSLSNFVIKSNGTILPAEPGDFDLDGDVDGNDFLIWQNGYGTASGATVWKGDTDHDGDVDGNDFLAWQNNYGSSVLIGLGDASFATVPEPGTLALLAAGGAAVAYLRRRRAA